MAPVIFPRAKLSFLLLIHIIELNFSGNSVTIGDIIIDKIKEAIPKVLDILLILSTNSSLANTIPIRDNIN
ncbi:hypothetical protein SDC9_205683 [bioreactor metagenome]|uniref:Uncharacterized protein n=1 Tax=bioreactor metagenome TaxID=1076179 RepID=A0A645J3L6_9ZZZZ